MTEKQYNDIQPNKKLGQHFLTDRNIINKIIDISGVSENDDILEIGPGMGALTIPLSGRVNSITAVEKDTRLFNYLQDRLKKEKIENVTLLNEDILKTDIEKIAGKSGNRLKVTGNLPYNISSPLLDKLIRDRTFISRAFLMFQQEFAQRLAAVPGNKEYGAITVMVRYHCNVLRLMEVSRNVFYPRPKIDSTVLEIDMGRPYPLRAKNDKIFRLVVKGAFAQRRKTIKNSLRVISDQFNTEVIADALEKCGINPGRRAETLDIEEYISLSDELYRVGSKA